MTCTPTMHIFTKPGGARCVCGEFDWDEAAEFNSQHMTPLDFAGVEVTAREHVDGETDAVEIRQGRRDH